MVKDDSYWRKNDDRFTARVKRVLSSKIKNADMAKRLACSERYIRKLKEKLRNEELLSRKRGARPALTSNALKNMRKKVKEKGEEETGLIVEPCESFSRKRLMKLQQNVVRYQENNFFPRRVREST